MVASEPSTAVSALLVVLALYAWAVLLLGLRLGSRVAGDDAARTRQLLGRVGLASAGWVALTGALALSGVLARFVLPPPMLFVFFAGVLLSVLLVRSTAGERLALHVPLAWLVGFQAFRIPVELMLHQLSEEGVIGVQMTYEGLNFDIVTGISAVVVAALLAVERCPTWLLWVWNVLGLALLITIVSIAILSMPLPFRQFDGPPNVMVAHVPFVWLPTMIVQAALIGHLLLFRRLISGTASPA